MVHGTWKTHLGTVSLLGTSLVPGLARIAEKLEGRTSRLQQSAHSLASAAVRKETEAAQDTAALKYLRQAQKELDAYAANYEGLITVAGNSHLRRLSPEFPAEAAELHALIDRSLSHMDRIAVDVARDASTPAARLVAARHHHAAHATAHVLRSRSSHSLSAAAIVHQQRRFDAQRAKHSVHRALMTRPGAGSLTQSLRNLSPEGLRQQSVLAKLRRVKAFGHHDAALHSDLGAPLSPMSVSGGCPREAMCI